MREEIKQRNTYREYLLLLRGKKKEDESNGVLDQSSEIDDNSVNILTEPEEKNNEEVITLESDWWRNERNRDHGPHVGEGEFIPLAGESHDIDKDNDWHGIESQRVKMNYGNDEYYSGKSGHDYDSGEEGRYTANGMESMGGFRKDEGNNHETWTQGGGQNDESFRDKGHFTSDDSNRRYTFVDEEHPTFDNDHYTKEQHYSNLKPYNDKNYDANYPREVDQEDEGMGEDHDSYVGGQRDDISRGYATSEHVYPPVLRGRVEETVDGYVVPPAETFDPNMGESHHPYQSGQRDESYRHDNDRDISDIYDPKDESQSHYERWEDGGDSTRVHNDPMPTKNQLDIDTGDSDDRSLSGSESVHGPSLGEDFYLTLSCFFL